MRKGVPLGKPINVCCGEAEIAQKVLNGLQAARLVSPILPRKEKFTAWPV